MLEIRDEQDVRGWLAAPDHGPAMFHSLDLRPFAQGFAQTTTAGCAFLDCELAPETAAQAVAEGAYVVSKAPGVPFRQFPSRWYTVATIYDGFQPGRPGSWADSYDHRCFRWFMEEQAVPRRLNAAEAVAAKLHDTAMEHAVGRYLKLCGRRAVAFMGGHDVSRRAPSYRDVAVLARDLHRLGFLVITGGGPGLMEAANLGAFLAPFADGELDVALKELAGAPDYKEVDAWLETACAVRARLLGTWDAPSHPGGPSLGIPTWLYGHEPPNLFASHIAKFFYNSLREDGLVSVSSGGIIFAEGNAGTVQEIFQDATQNYYRGRLAPTPMVLLGRDYWHRSAHPADPKAKPLYPLLKRLAEEKGFEHALLLTDDLEEAREFVVAAARAAEVELRLADERIPELGLSARPTEDATERRAARAYVEGLLRAAERDRYRVGAGEDAVADGCVYALWEIAARLGAGRPLAREAGRERAAILDFVGAVLARCEEERAAGSGETPEAEGRVAVLQGLYSALEAGAHRR
ncbi:hypothetical protein [Caulobacter sp. 17J65-9]|uniref:LOG family protein n=1 Tax=Caulobacter sp. 17J65-9 TaxID=2709382 RepID=UPI0013CC6A88|nr:hypothetical protein [Caulobacter sp. 17J65-9]NEX91885.1 hypothetical protein [Caulobacter sp. 17J65-9]